MNTHKNMNTHKKRSATAVLSLALVMMMAVPALAQRMVTVPNGTVIPLKMETYLASDTSRVGDRFTATVFRNVDINGRIVIPSGSKVEGHVTAVERSERSSKAGTVGVAFDRLVLTNGQSIQVDGTLTTLDEAARQQIDQDRIDQEDRVEGGSRTRRAVVFIGGGAGAGAIIGAVAGGAKGAAVGAGVGAVLGTIGVLLGKGEKAEIKPGTEFGMMVERSFTVNADGLGVAGDSTSSDPGVQSSVLTSGDSIRSAQTILRDRGYYNGPINGIMSAATRTSIRNFQRDRNIDMTGDLDTRTARELGIESSSVIDSGAQSSVTFTSTESIRSAQMVLRDRGYYTGAINGTLTGPTRTAIRNFQRDRNIAQTGDLDGRTARELGIANDRGDQTNPVEIRNPIAERIGRDSVRISFEAQTRGRGWRVFADSFVSGSTLHVYARGEATQAGGGFGAQSHPISETINNTSGVTRVVFHGAERDITVDLSSGGTNAGGGTGSGTATGVGNARQIAFLTNRLLMNYSRELNIRSNRGQVTFDSRRDFRQNEVEILFQLHALEAAANLYTQMVASVSDPAAVREAAGSLLRQARLLNRFWKRDTSPKSTVIENDWQQLRSELARISVTDANLDNDNDRIQ